MKSTIEPKANLYAYSIWACAALFYMYQFILRVAPAIMVQDLMETFQINATALGSLSAITMYAYSCLQIPSGALTDHWGVKRIMLCSLSLCIVGALLFASARNTMEAQFGRLLIGAGSSTAFLSSGKIAATYFPEKRRATLFGLTMAAGTLGALNGGIPLAYLQSLIGWRDSMRVLAAIGLGVLGLSGLSFYVLKKDKKLKNHTTHEIKPTLQHKPLQAIQYVLTHSEVWVHSLVAVGLYLPVAVLADLWGPSFMIERFHVDKQLASQTVSFIYIGLFTGSLLIPLLSHFFNQRKKIIVFCVFTITLLLCVILYDGLYGFHLSITVVSIIFLLIGFLTGAEMLCFSGACSAVSTAFAGTVTGVVNGIVMFSVACTQNAVGNLLDYFWQGILLDKTARFYSVKEFQLALSILPITTGISCIIALQLKDSLKISQHS